MLPVEIYIPQPEFGHRAELAMIAALRNNGPDLIARYLDKETKSGVTFIARDAAKRLFPEYNENRTRHNRFSDRAASALADAARRTVLARPLLRPRDEVILFTGAPASGKSAAARPFKMDAVEMVHETIFTSLARAMSIVQDVLSADRYPMVSLVYTSDPRINVRRMIHRARRIGRTVPLAFMAETYVGVPRIVSAVHDEFGSFMRLLLTDNSRQPEDVFQHSSIGIALRITGRYTKESCLEVMDDELAQIDEAEPIPPDILHEARIR